MLSPVSMASVSNVRFGDSALDRQGAYAKPAETAAAPVKEKKSGSSKAVKGVLAVAVLAVLVGLRKGNILKPLEDAALKDTKWYNPKLAGHYLAKAADFVAKYTWDPVARFIGKKGADKSQASMVA